MSFDPDIPFHEGEILIQERYGVVERVGAFAKRAVRDHLTEQHRDFFRELPFVVLGSVDSEGRPWASIVAGDAGFLSTPSDRQLRVGARPVSGDPLLRSLRTGSRIGGLGIQLETRRRNRFTGRVAAVDETGFTLSVDQTFGNCPQYIVTRAPAKALAAPAVAPERVAGLDAEARAMIGAADTFFVATAAPADSDLRHGADVSHRGGKPGFVRVDADGTLTIPDFTGNLHFNTLGNILLNPRAGLLFADFANGDLLLLTGTAEVDFDGAEVRAFQGAERLWRFRAEEGLRLRGALPLRFEAGEASPTTLVTGDWSEAAARLDAEARCNVWRTWRIVKIRDESKTIRSLLLAPADGGGRPSFKAGQFLPIRLEVPGIGPLIRTYTVSSPPEEAPLRISVKRQGVASTYLHGLAVGDVIEAQAPRGSFTIDTAQRRPVVLLSAGIGVTPMIAMLRHLVAEGRRTRHTRRTWFIHAARTKAERAFAAEARAAASDRVHVVSILTQPEVGERAGIDHDHSGRLTVETLKGILPFDDYDFYLCGPGGFVQDLYDGLRELDVADGRIFFETFGPTSLRRRPDGAVRSAPEGAAAAEVTFSASAKTVEWTPEKGTLLELAESAGLTPAYGCRSGVCGTCSARVSGRVRYLTEPTAPVGEGEVLICSAVPDTDGNRAVLSLEL